MSRRSPLSGVLALVIGAAALAAAAPSRAEDAPKEKPWYEAILVNGLVEASYTSNFNRPDSNASQLRVFDTDVNTFRLDVVELILQKKAAAPGEVGFRVDAFAGSSIPRITAAYGLFRDENGKAQDFDLFQAYVSWVAPLGTGLRIDAGKYGTPVCYEVPESGVDGLNDNATRSILFGYAVPATHTGLRATYAFSGRLTAQLHLANGWDDARDNNGGKTVGAQLAWTPNAAVSVTANAMTGPEKPGNARDFRTLYDLIATWKASGRLTLTVNGDWASEQRDREGGANARWYGAAGYARLALDTTFALCLRAELFRDADGVRTGTAQTVKEVTITPEWKLGKGLVLRGDLRHDWSSEPVFQRRGKASKGQTTAMLDVLYVF